MNFLFICLIALLTSNAMAFDNEPEGFRGIKWFDKFSQHKSKFIFLAKNDTDYFYSRKNEKLEIGVAKLDAVTYVFNSRGFKSVMISFHGEKNKTSLLSALFKRYGEGVKPNRYMDRYYWYGPNSTLIFDCDAIGTNCTAVLYSQIMYTIEELDLNNKSKNLDADF